MGMGIRSAMGWEWDGNGNEVIEMGGNWYETYMFPHTSTSDTAAETYAGCLAALQD